MARGLHSRRQASLMNLDRVKRRAFHSSLFVGTLFVLCGVLGFLQYRWTGEVSLAARDRLRASLQSSLFRLSQDFNSEIATACRATVPSNQSFGAENAETEIAARFNDWKRVSHHRQLFSTIVLAVPRQGELALRSLDFERGTFVPAEWPPEWTPVKERLELWANRPGRGFFAGPPRDGDPLAIEVPLFEMAMPRPRSEPPGFGRREAPWLIFELNLPYLRDSVLPELIQRHLGSEEAPEYQVEILTRSTPPAVIYESDPGRVPRIAASADASVGLLDLRREQFRRWGPPGLRDREPGQVLGRPPAPARPGLGFERWEMFVRHRAGSLDAVTSRARWRNLAVIVGVLLLMVATATALMHFTRRAQRLAELQMNFVAGVSHELRTPLTVIHTAAYNLRGKVASNPAQVERYGALIQQESGRLKELVEQVLRFAGAEAGYVIGKPERLSLENVIEETLDSAKPLIDSTRCTVEKNIEPGLPSVLGDRVALKHALGNLLSNAAKYGTKGGNWIGVFASGTDGRERPAVEVRIADRGPGIPAEERDQIFEPFFRGQRAIQDQVHGTGLGLNLARKIVEAHGGTIRVTSEPAKGTEFTVRLPAAPAEA